MGFAVSRRADGAEVLERFAAILSRAWQHRSRLDYFAALYRGVTLRARSALAAGAFEQPQAAERRVVLFANRYFESLAGHLADAPVTRSWLICLRRRRALEADPATGGFRRFNDLLQMVDEGQDRLAGRCCGWSTGSPAACCRGAGSAC